MSTIIDLSIPTQIKLQVGTFNATANSKVNKAVASNTGACGDNATQLTAIKIG